MPSFNVGAGVYEYFLGNTFNDRKYTENINGYLDEKRAIPKFLAYLSCTAIFFFIMHIWHFSWDFLNAHYPEQYKQNRWYFEFDIVLMLWQSLFMISIFILLTSVVHKDSSNMFHRIIVKHDRYKLFLYIVSILLLTLFLLIPITILSYNDEESGTHHLFDENDAICKVVLCEYLYIRFVLIYMAYPGFIPPFLFIVWLIIHKIEQKRKIRKRTSIQMEILLENDFDGNKKDDYKSSKKHQSSFKQILYPLMLLFGFSFSFVISFIFGHIHGVPIEQNFELIYWCLGIYTMGSKFCHKWIALRCDEWRTVNSDNNYTFSIEWFVEFYWDLTYWMIYRYYTIFNVPSTGIFILTLITHLSWEFCAVFIRLTQKYFKVTTYLTYNSIP